MLFGCSLNSTRYTLLTPKTVWYVLGLEALHGVTFALMWTAAVEYSKQHSPKGWDATVQSIVTV